MSMPSDVVRSVHVMRIVETHPPVAEPVAGYRHRQAPVRSPRPGSRSETAQACATSSASHHDRLAVVGVAFSTNVQRVPMSLISATDRARVSSSSSVQTMYARARAGTTLLGEHTRSDVSINSSVTASPLVGAASRTFSSWSSPGELTSTTKYNSYRPELE